VVDPGLVLADLLVALRGRLRRADGRAAGSGPGPRQVLERTDAAIRRAAAGRATEGTALDARITRRSSLAVTRLRAGEGRGAIPSTCRARLDLRLAPGVVPAVVLDGVRELVGGRVPGGVSVDLAVRSASTGWAAVPDAVSRRAADVACRTGFGLPPVYVRSGGTIPAVAMLERAFGRVPLLLGFGLPGGRAHGPDEAMDLDGWARAVDTSVAFLAALAESGQP
jgi:succinyl-diaminopimelate desuccinylase